MPQPSAPVFVVGLAEAGTPPQHQPIASHAPAPIPAPAAITTSTTMYQTNQERDTALLRELAAANVNKALAALNANDPAGATKALSDAQGYLSRFATAHDALAITNARKANEFHGYSISNPDASREHTRHLGPYDLNNPEGK